MEFKQPEGILVPFSSPKSSMREGGAKKEREKDGVHEPHFKGKSNEAVQCLEEDGDLAAFL